MKIQIKEDKIKEKGITSTADVEKKLDITLTAKPTDVDTGKPNMVNGYINTFYKKGKKVYEVVLYDKDKDVDYEEYTYRGNTYTKGTKVVYKKKDILLSNAKDLIDESPVI